MVRFINCKSSLSGHSLIVVLICRRKCIIIQSTAAVSCGRSDRVVGPGKSTGNLIGVVSRVMRFSCQGRFCKCIAVHDFLRLNRSGVRYSLVYSDRDFLLDRLIIIRIFRNKSALIRTTRNLQGSISIHPLPGAFNICCPLSGNVDTAQLLIRMIDCCIRRRSGCDHGNSFIHSHFKPAGQGSIVLAVRCKRPRHSVLSGGKNRFRRIIREFPGQGFAGQCSHKGGILCAGICKRLTIYQGFGSLDCFAVFYSNCALFNNIGKRITSQCAVLVSSVFHIYIKSICSCLSGLPAAGISR